MPNGFPYEVQPYQVLPELGGKFVNLTQAEAEKEFQFIEWDWVRVHKVMQQAYQIGARDASALLAVSDG